MAHLRVTPDKVIEFPMMLYTSIPASVKLENISETMQCIAFKVKTTAPKKYLVRPSTGVIKHNEECDVQITLQPLTEEVGACADRFLIQYSLVESDKPLSRDYWVNVNKSCVFDKKLSVAFKSAADHMSPSASSGARGHVNKSVTQQQSPISSYDTAAATEANVQVNSATDFVPVGGGGVATNYGSSVAASPMNQNDVLLKQKYDELVHYCLAVEKQKNSLQKENDALKKNVQEQMTIQTRRNRSFFDIWHMLPLLLGAYILAKLFGFL